ncbi:hypothetical protein ES703_48639 [subsurface metagenome]
MSGQILVITINLIYIGGCFATLDAVIGLEIH